MSQITELTKGKPSKSPAPTQVCLLPTLIKSLSLICGIQLWVAPFRNPQGAFKFRFLGPTPQRSWFCRGSGACDFGGSCFLSRWPHDSDIQPGLELLPRTTLILALRLPLGTTTKKTPPIITTSLMPWIWSLSISELGKTLGKIFLSRRQVYCYKTIKGALLKLPDFLWNEN